MTAAADSREMPEMFTDGWVAWLDSVLSQFQVDSAVDLVLEHRVINPDGSDFCWHVRVVSGRISAAPGPAGAGHGHRLVSFTSDHETARAVAVEGKSAQRAFAEGQLSLGGDPRLLLEARPAIEALGATLAAHAGAAASRAST